MMESDQHPSPAEVAPTPAASATSLPMAVIQRFDFLSRFFYSRLRFYRIVRWFKPKLHQSNFRILDSYFNGIMELLTRFKFPVKGATIMEIGPGNACIIPYNFLQAGAARVILVDKFPRRDDTEEQRQYARSEIEHFKERWDTDTIAFADERTGLPRAECITLLTGDLEDIELPTPVDIIYSIAVLQHVPNIGSYLKKMSTLLKQGGVMYHAVDLKDKWHSLGRPFRFYRYSEWTWNHFLTDPSVTYTNRLRFDEYVDLFKENGFELIWKQTGENPVNEPRIHPRFAGRTDLHIGAGVFLLVKK